MAGGRMFTTKFLMLSFLSCVCIILLYYIVNNKDKFTTTSSKNTFKVPLSLNDSSNFPKPSTENVDIKAYAMQLAKYSSKDHWILLTLIDQGCRDMALNFYESSLKKFNIGNYLFLASDQQTCDDVIEHGINCFVYKVDKAAGKASVYLSKDFLRKMNIRTDMILDALHLGYNILHTDVDMTFLRNPFEDFSYLSDTYDVAPLWDCGAYNAGFLFIRNTPPATKVYLRSKQITQRKPKIDDQNSLNMALREVKKSRGLKVQMLNRKKYLCGKAYFEDTARAFVGGHPCSNCVVVHHNWIVSMEAKTYRMKEMHMWMYDGNQYYSSPDRKYLYYENPTSTFDPETEISALKNAVAIGEILNRTVIYPRFHCKNSKPCTILNFILLRKLVSLYPNYRENTFLQHPKVNKKVTESKSKKYLISSSPIKQFNKNEVTVLEPQDSTKGATDEEIRNWFSHESASVLQFHSLYNAFCCWTNNEVNTAFSKKLDEAFKKAEYRQFDK